MIANVLLVAPSGTTTLLSIVAYRGSPALTMMWAPPGGAGAASVTVPVTVSPDSTGLGEIVGLAIAEGLTFSDARFVWANVGAVASRSAHAAATLRPTTRAR